MVSLQKPGSKNPENLDNYRGICLISVTLKLLLTILNMKLSKAAEEAGLLSKEQAGFRSREEAIAQFIAMQEVIRRRWAYGTDTLGVFINFKKAYDRVHHSTLFRVLEHLGIWGKFL